MTALAPAEYAALLRRDFCAFVQRSFHELYPQSEFLWNWHIEVMAAKLADCFAGKIKRLVINVPPRHLKSLCASIALPAWWLGRDAAAQIICVSYGQELADKHARDCRAVMASAFYRRTFSTRLSAQKQSTQEFVTTAGGFRFATSVGGVLTGRGGDVVIIDDPLKPDEALSQTQRKAVNEWYDHTLVSRLNDKRAGAIVLVMQRLHQDDLAGHVLAQEPWEIVSFPAIAEADESHAIDTPLGAVRFTRRAGEVLHPAREPAAALSRIRSAIGEYHFAGQYQQAPSPRGGGLVREEWLRRYAPAELPHKFEQIAQSWDTANKPTELADYSVCTTWGVKDRHFYLLSVLRKRFDYPALKRAVREQADAFGAGVILIEDKASGTQLIQELAEAGLHAVTRYVPECDKTMRLHAQTGAIENGFVHVPTQAHWLAEYVHELTTFPAGRYDDQVDSTAQFLDWSKRRPAGWGLAEHYRRSAESRRQSGIGRMVTLRAPPGVTQVHTIGGRALNVGIAGMVEVGEEEAGALRAAGFAEA